MMYAKLITRNLRRSTKEYAIYILTLMLAVTLMYAFNGIAFSSEVQNLSRHMDSMVSGIIMASVVIVLVLGWLIYYISNFILQKRSQEFGLYLLMGMTRKQVSRMFLLEQICMGILAFIIGCILGVFVYQIILAVIMQLFETSYFFELSFSFESITLTLLYFAGIYILELLRERYFLYKKKIYELLYCDRKIEKTRHSSILSGICFVLGLGTFIWGLWKLEQAFQSVNNQTGYYMMMGIGLIVLSIFLLYFGLSYRLSNFINQHRNIKYQGNALYLFAQIITRLSTSRVVLALLSILTLSTFLLISITIKLNEAQKEVGNTIPFDIQASISLNMTEEKDKKESFDNTENILDSRPITDYLEKHKIAYQDYHYSLYQTNYDTSSIKNMLQEKGSHVGNFNYMKYSDYCALMKLLKYKPLKLAEDEYLLLTFAELKEEMQSDLRDYQFGGLHLKAIETRNIGQRRSHRIQFIVPDELLVNTKQKCYEQYVVKSKMISKNEWADKMEEPFYRINPYSSLIVKADYISANLTGFIIIVFSLIYLSIILSCVSATVLALQQMSDIWKQKDGYQMLWKMGMSRKEIHRLLQHQIAIYFFIPFLISVIYSIPITYILDGLFVKTFAKASMIPYTCIAIVFYLLIYFGYYLMAYFSSKRSIDESCFQSLKYM